MRYIVPIHVVDYRITLKCLSDLVMRLQFVMPDRFFFLQGRIHQSFSNCQY